MISELKQNLPSTIWLIHQDGLLDIFLGISILGFSLDLLFNTSTWFLPVWLGAYALVMVIGKEWITRPRLAHFQVSKEQQRRMLRGIITVILLGAWIAVVGLFTHLLLQNNLPGLRDFVEQYLWFGIGLGGALGVSLLAFFGAAGKHFYVYSILVMILLGMMAALQLTITPLLVSFGGMMTMFGGVLLAKFINTYPKIEHPYTIL